MPLHRINDKLVFRTEHIHGVEVRQVVADWNVYIHTHGAEILAGTHANEATAQALATELHHAIEENPHEAIARVAYA